MITPWGGIVSYRDQTSSTMDDARALEDGGHPDGSVAWAGFQTQGRGRHPGRTWYGTAGESLLLTGYWRPDRFRVPDFAPSLVAGLGLCLWLESLISDPAWPVSLKWPNDVYLADQKAVGILVQRRWGVSQGSIHVGIGVNLGSVDSHHNLRAPAVSLRDAGVLLTPQAALDGLLPFLAQAWDEPDPRSQCARRLWRRGNLLTLALPDGSSPSGVVRGLDPSGALVWDVSGSRQILNSGE